MFSLSFLDDLRKEPRIFFERKQRKQFVVVRVATSCCGALVIMSIEKNIDSEQYFQVLQTRLKQTAAETLGEIWNISGRLFTRP